MKRTETQPLKEVLRQYVDALGAKHKLKEKSIRQTWDKLMGPFIANKTTNAYMKNKILYVHLSSPALRQELSMMQSKIIQNINEFLGEDMVQKVVLR